MCVSRIVRNILEINCGGDDDRTTTDDKNQQTSFGEYYRSAPMNGYGAKLSREVNNERQNLRQNGVTDDVDTDRLAACRMTPLEDVTLSDDYSATVGSSSTIDRPQTASVSPLRVEVADSTSTSVPDTTKRHDATNSSSPKSTDNGQSGSVSYGTSGKDFVLEPIMCFEPKSSSATASSANSGGHGVQFRSPSVEHSVWNRDRRASHGTASGRLNKDLESETSICREETCFAEPSESGVKDNLLTVRNRVCNGDDVQHPADKLYDSIDIEDGTVIHGEGNRFSAASSLRSSAVSRGSDVDGQSSTMPLEDSVCTGERHPDCTVRDSGCRQNVSNTNVPWSADGRSMQAEINSTSATTCASAAGWVPTSWSLGSSYSGGSRMKGLRIPSAARTSTAPSAVVRPCLDLPLIAGGVAARRRIVGDSSSTSNVLPATLLPRPFMPRSCYRSVRPAFSSSATAETADNRDSRHLTTRAGSSAAPAITSVTGSTSVNDAAEKSSAGNCSISSSREQPDSNKIRPSYAVSFSLLETPPQTGESNTLGASGSEKTICPSTTHLCQPLSSEVADSNGFLTPSDFPGLNTSEESNCTIDSRRSILVGSRQQPDNVDEFTDSRSSEDVRESPNSTTPGQPSLTDDRHPGAVCVAVIVNSGNN